MRILASIALVSIVAVVATSRCAPEPKKRRISVGQSLQLKPLQLDTRLLAKKDETAAIKLHVMWGGRPLDPSAESLVISFEDDQGESLYEKSWGDLQDAFRTTGCSDTQVSSLDGYLLGNALICDGSLDFSKVRLVKGTDESGKQRSATSWSIYRASEDVITVSLGLY